MQTWDQERLGLLALGYSRVLYVHIHCVTCGLFRCGLPEEPEIYACPRCRQACKATILAAGYTKLALPLEPTLLVAPLSTKSRDWLMVEEKIRKPRRVTDWHHGRKLRKLRAAATSLSFVAK